MVRVFFFLLWPLFARAPRHGFLEIFLLSARVCKVFFFFVALRWAPRRGQSKKKNTTQGVFFCSGPGERQGKEKPRWAPARGQSKKKNTTQGVFFCSGLGRRHGARAKKKTPPRVLFFLIRPRGKTGEGEVRWAPRRGQSKKKTPPRVFFFCSGPGERQGKEKPRWAPARGQSKKKKHPGCFFFCSGLGRRHGARAKKKTPPRVIFFLLRPRGKRQGKEKLRWAPARGQSKKKNTTPPRVFFFCSGPGERGRGRRSLGAGTGPEQKKKTPPRVFFFAPALGAGTGPEQKKNTTQGDFFLLRRDFRGGPAGTLTYVLWAEAILPAGFVFCFFLAAAPRGRSLTHCRLGPRCFRHAPGVFAFFCCGPARTRTH